MKFSKVPCDMSVYSIGNDEGNLMKVKIVVMHEKKNRNRTSFSMEAIEKALGTYGRFDEAVKKIDPRQE